MDRTTIIALAIIASTTALAFVGKLEPTTVLSAVAGGAFGLAVPKGKNSNNDN